MSDDLGVIPPYGNYAELLAYQKAEVVYDLTFRFCERMTRARLQYRNKAHLSNESHDGHRPSPGDPGGRP